MQVQPLASLSGLMIWLCGIGYRCGLGLVLLWLWCRLGGAALILLLAWEIPYATVAALKKKKKKKKKVCVGETKKKERKGAASPLTKVDIETKNSLQAKSCINPFNLHILSLKHIFATFN